MRKALGMSYVGETMVTDAVHDPKVLGNSDLREVFRDGSEDLLILTL